MSYFHRIFSLAGILLVLSSCSQPDPEASRVVSGKPVVYVANYPLAYFTERIAGERVEVRFPIPAGEDPAFWNPSDEVVTKMQSADLVVLNGASYEKWLASRSLPASLLVDTSKAFSGEFIATAGQSHSHGTGKAHSHGGVAFTTWMDMQQAIWQAEEIRDGLIRILPGEESTLRESFDALADDLDGLHAEFRIAGEAIGDTPLVASHPVYQYFARRYDLAIEAVHWEPGSVPDEARQDELKSILKTHPAKWMIWEDEPVSESVALLKSLGVESVVVTPCGNRPESGDWLSVMKENVERLGTISNP